MTLTGLKIKLSEKLARCRSWLLSHPQLGWYLTFFLFLNYVFDLARIFLH